MGLNRREFLAGLATATAAAQTPKSGAAAIARVRLGVMDGVVRQSGRPAAFAEARQMGLAALQVTLGRPATGAEDRLPLEDRALQEALLAASRENQVPIDATYIDILHADCLKQDAAAVKWVERGIDITRRLNARILMTVFFGKCALATPAEIDAVIPPFRTLARKAEDAGVILGFENLLNARDNLRVFDAVRSPAFQIYYDVGNATNMVGVDAAAEIRALGRERICQFHFKDKGYLGEGKVAYAPILDAIRDIGYDGYANLETSAVSQDWRADLRRNIAYLRPLLAERGLA